MIVGAMQLLRVRFVSSRESETRSESKFWCTEKAIAPGTFFTILQILLHAHALTRTLVNARNRAVGALTRFIRNDFTSSIICTIFGHRSCLAPRQWKRANWVLDVWCVCW